MQTWFNTLNEALLSEGLLDAWDPAFRGIEYGSNFSWTWDDGSRYGHQISIYRNTSGMYERLIHYTR